jgi:hypothetical protein
MTATSFDRTAAAIGARAWRRLHLIGGYYLLFQFMVSFGKRIPDMPLYALFLIPLVAVFALRMIAMAPRRTSDGADGLSSAVYSSVRLGERGGLNVRFNPFNDHCSGNPKCRSGPTAEVAVPARRRGASLWKSQLCGGRR